MLTQLLEGVADGAALLLVDLIPSRPFQFPVSHVNMNIFFAGRFSEWSKAVWKLLQGAAGDSTKYHYFGTVVPDEYNPALFRTLKEQTTAMIMKDIGFAERVLWTLVATKVLLVCSDLFGSIQEWWDHSEEAGAAARPAARFEQPAPEMKVLTIDDDLKTARTVK